MQQLNTEAGRGSGFWLNPNSGGIMCALLLFLSFTHPFQKRWLNWTTRSLFIIGVAVSFSRSAMLVMFVGWVVYGITAGRFRALIASLVGFAICMASIFVVLNSIEALSPHHATRMQFVRAFLTGDWSASGADTRTEIWKMSFQTIVDKEALIFGLGHGAMGRSAGGWAPHNTYIQVLGNSGILALLALLAWLFILAQQGWQSYPRNTRAALMAIAAIVASALMFDNTFLDNPFSGAIIACFTLVACFGKAKVRHLGPSRPSPVAGTRLRPC
jgi:O-antigen ligase